MSPAALLRRPDVAFGFTTLQNAALTGTGTLTKTAEATFFLGAGSGNTFSGNISLAVNGGTFQVGSSVSSSPAGGSTLSSLTSANTLTVNRGATFSILLDNCPAPDNWPFASSLAVPI